MKISQFALLIALFAVATAASRPSRCPRYIYKVVRSTSGNAEGLSRAVSKYRTLLGGDDNGSTKGPLSKGHRSINWDAAALPFNMPFDFFNTNAPRGTVFFTRRQKFAVSNPASPPPVDDRFSSINRRASRHFITFSPKRLFTPVLSNRVRVKFFVPGAQVKAGVSGFGAIFVDAEKEGASFFVVRDKRGCKIAKVGVPPRKNGLSFVGVLVRGARYWHHGRWVRRSVQAPIAKVDIKLGTTPIKKRWNHRRHGDVVVLDDLIYGEPQKL